MANCSFCGKALRPGCGEMYVPNDGRIMYFDSLKCKTYLLKHGKVARKFKWTEAHKLAKQDSGKKEKAPKAEAKAEQK